MIRSISKLGVPFLCAMALGIGPSTALGQDDAAPSPEEGEQVKLPPGFDWKTEGTGPLGDRARVKIREGTVYLDSKGTSRLMTEMGNLSDGDELGLIGTDDLRWFAIFFFDEIGYVKDDEKEDLDAEDIASKIREGLEYSNQERQKRGFETLTFDGWSIPPRYNQDSNQLEWASRYRSPSGVSVNYNTRILGRKGVIRVILATDPELLDASLPEFRSSMSGFEFIDGERYAEYQSGDKIAEYGLIALVAGGAGAVAAKTGLLGAIVVFFKKGFKLILVGLLAIGAFLKKIFFGTSRVTDDTPPPTDDRPVA